MTANRIQRLLRLIALTAAFGLAGSAAVAQGHAGMQGVRGGSDRMMAGGHGDHAGQGGGLFGRHMDHALDLVNATDAQRSQIEAIFKAAKTDLQGQREAGAKLRMTLLDLFAATNIDAAAVEATRVQLNLIHDAVTKRMSQASVDAARVLSPEQRAKLVEMMKKRAARMASRKG